MSVLVKVLTHTFNSTHFLMSWVVLKIELELTIPIQASTPPLVQMPLPSTQHPVIFLNENLCVKK
jgi:hypothetical protein